MAKYKVGYKKPPVDRQFKKGQCANPNGRRGNKPPTPEELTDAEILAQIDSELMFVDGQWISCLEVQMRMLRALAMTGDLAAIELLEDMRRYDAQDVNQQGGCLLLPPPVTLEEWMEAAAIQQAPFRETQPANSDPSCPDDPRNHKKSV